MQERHQRRQIAMRRDQTVVDIARMARGVAQARNTRHFREPLQQAPERESTAAGAFAMIGVHVLPKQRDLTHAGIGQPLDFGQDLG